MANVKTKLDTRRVKSDGTYNVIFRITHLKKIYTINSGVAISEKHWNATKAEILRIHPNAKRLNLKLLKTYYRIEEALLELDHDFTIDKLRSKLGYSTKNALNLTFKEFANNVITQMFEVNRTGNAIVYRTAVNRLVAFSNEKVKFDDIDYVLLTKFEHYLKTSGLKQNSISNYFRSIRALYNLAIKQKLVNRANYPFRDISIKSERTAKRAITKADINRLNSHQIDENKQIELALNYFMLSFYLRGMSFTDMAYLTCKNFQEGRIIYNRRKTGKYYSIKVFPVAEAILNNLSREDNLYLLPILPNSIIEDSLEAKKLIQYWVKTTNKYLKHLSKEVNLESNVTTYVSRHSFASIAKHLGYSNELIAEALGHEYGNRVTNIYLDAFDTNKLDKMHENVISL